MKDRERKHLLELSPSFAKWINTCISCGVQGYKPTMSPEYFFAGIGFYDIQRLFEELRLDEYGLCPQCSAAAGKPSSYDGSTNI
jgi:hypothetical protein